MGVYVSLWGQCLVGHGHEAPSKLTQEHVGQHDTPLRPLDPTSDFILAREAPWQPTVPSFEPP